MVECGERIAESALFKGVTVLSNVRSPLFSRTTLFLPPILNLLLFSASLECLAALLKTKSILLSDVLRTNDLYEQLFKQIKYHGNSVPLAQARVSLFRAIESLIEGVGFGQPLPQLNEAVSKIFKYWASCTERSLQVWSAAARCLSTWTPFAASSYSTTGTIRALLLKELPTSSSFGHVYGCLLFTALKESYTKEAVQPVQTLPPSKPGAPPHDSAGILGYKEYESLEAILEHIQNMWLKVGAKREARESLAAACVALFSRISFQFLEKKLSLILALFFNLISASNTKMYGSELDEAKSSITYILHSGIISNCTEDGKRLVFKELLSLLEQATTAFDGNAQTAAPASPSAPKTMDVSRVSMILSEVYALFSELGESIVTIITPSGSGATIEDLLLKLIAQQQVTITTPQHRTLFASHSSSPYVDGNLIWLWCGLVLKRYCAVNDQFFISVDKLLSLLPSPLGKSASQLDPLPIVWAYANTKRTRPASSAEFGAVLTIVQSLLNGPLGASVNAPSTTNSWTVAGWMLLSSLLLRGTGQSAEQDRASMVSAHLATLQHLWKQELSKRPVSDSELSEFAVVKLWLLYSLKHFLANFSRLVHESNLTTFTTQCLNTVLKSVSSWQATNTTPKSERDCAVIDALIIALLQSYTTLATHIFNPPSTMSPRQQSLPIGNANDASSSSSSSSSSASSFPARSVLQMIAKQMTRPRYVSTSWMVQRYLHVEDEALDFNTAPQTGTFPASATLYTDLHGCTSSIAHASSLLWSEWSTVFLQTQQQTGSRSATSGDALHATIAAQLSNSNNNTDSLSLYLPPAALLLGEMASLFPPLFHQQQESHQLQLLQYLSSCLASNTSQTAPVHVNVLFFLLAIAKENAKLSGTHQIGTLLASSPSAMQNKPLARAILNHIVSLVDPYISSPISMLRRLAADILSYAIDADESGLLGPTIKRLQQTLWTGCGYNGLTPSAQIPPPTTSLAQLIKNLHSVEGSMFSLGSIHRVVGGIRSRQYMSDTIKVLMAIVRITFETRPPSTSNTPASAQHVSLHRTALHALWVALEATGLSDTSFASSTLSAMLDGLISDASREWQTISHMGRIVGSIAAVLGPELQGSVSLLRRLQGAIILLDCVGSIEVEDAEVSFNSSSPLPLGTDWVPPRSLATTCLAYTASTVLRERLLLFAPQFIDASKSSAKLLKYVRSLHRNTDFDAGSRDAALLSPVTQMRTNALRVLRFLAQLNPQAFQNDVFISQIVLCPEREPLDSAVRMEMNVLIGTLEETLVPLDPLKWLAYASHFVMGSESDVKLDLSPSPVAVSPASSSSTAGASSSTNGPVKPPTGLSASMPPVPSPKNGKPLSSSTSRFGSHNNDDDETPEGEPMDETEEEMAGINTLSAPVVERVSASGDDSLRTLSSSLTALFVSSLHYVFEPLRSQPEHFDIVLAAKKRAEALSKAQPSLRFLVDSLPGIVALASKASSATIAKLQISGLESIHDILQRFCETADNQLEGHFLLELYVAQMSASLRRCIARDSPVANRVCHASYVVLAEMILWIAKHVSDVAALRQLVRPFLDASLEKKPLHAQSFPTSTTATTTTATATATMTLSSSEMMELDSPVALELNPRYVAWLIASALLWGGCKAIQSKEPGPSQAAAQEVASAPSGVVYLRDSAGDPKLRKALCAGWLSILEYRAVQQYSQDLTQLTLFGSSSQGAGLKNDILSNTSALGVNWCHVLEAMAAQYAEHVWTTLGEIEQHYKQQGGDEGQDSSSRNAALDESIANARIELSRSAHIMFGLILHNLANATLISQSLNALEQLMNCLSLLASKSVSSASQSLLPLPATAVTELAHVLANLLGVIHYRDYTQKAQLLSAATATIVYCGLQNRSFLPMMDTHYADSPASPPLPSSSASPSSSFFKEDSGIAANQVFLNEVIIEAMEHAAQCSPSTRHPASYIAALLTNIPKVWNVLNPSDANQAELALWMSKLVRLSTPDLPSSVVQNQLVPLVLDCWQVVSQASTNSSAMLVKHSISQAGALAERITTGGRWAEDDVNEANFIANALSRCITTLSTQTAEPYGALISVAVRSLLHAPLSTHGSGIPILRSLVQKALAVGNTALSSSLLAIIVPILFQEISTESSANFNAAGMSKFELETRQELLKIAVLLQNAPGLKDIPHAFALVLAALIRLLCPHALPLGSPYTPIHDSSLAVLLHIAQTNSDQFKVAVADLDIAERTAFEAAVRAHLEKQQAQQAAQSAGKAKFSFDTSQYAK